MTRRVWLGIVAAALLFGLAGDTAWAKKKTKRSDRNVTIEITYGVVESIETVKLKSKAASGAAIGGFAGLAASSGDTQENLETAAAGAALGALIAHLATKHKAQSYLIRQLDGSEIKVIIDHADAMAGDCVAIEEGPHTNLRRVEQTLCTDGEHHEDVEIQVSTQNDAAECHAAKEQLLDAATEEEINRAADKVKILCQ